MGFLSRSQSPAQPVQEGSARRRLLDLRTWVRNSPWLAIAVLIHVLLVAVLSIVYMASERPKGDARTTSIKIADRRLELPAPIEEPRAIFDRTLVPVLPISREGPVNPDPSYELDAEAGRPGEITDATDPHKDAGIFNPCLLYTSPSPRDS